MNNKNDSYNWEEDDWEDEDDNNSGGYFFFPARDLSSMRYFEALEKLGCFFNNYLKENKDNENKKEK